MSLCVPVSISISYNVFFCYIFLFGCFVLVRFVFELLYFIIIPYIPVCFFKERQKGWKGRWEVTKKRGVKGGKDQN